MSFSTDSTIEETADQQRAPTSMTSSSNASFELLSGGNGGGGGQSHGSTTDQQQQMGFHAKVMKMEMELKEAKQLCLIQELEIKNLQAKLEQQKLLDERNVLQSIVDKMEQEQQQQKKDNAFDGQLKQMQNDQKKMAEEMVKFGNQQQMLAKFCEQFAGIESSMAQNQQLDNFVAVLKDRLGNGLLKAVHPDLRVNIAERFSNPCQNCWDATSCHGDFEIFGPECFMVHCKGDGKGWRSVFAKCPLLINDSAGLFYFEVRVQNVNNSMAIGLATKAMPLEDQMVGHYPDSFGYSNDGILHVNGTHLHYENANFSRGDIVGCGVNLATRRVIFTKNGQPLDTSDLFVNSPIDSLFPCLSLENSGDLANANFGPDFKFSLAQVKVPIKLQQNWWDANACHSELEISEPKCRMVHYKENGKKCKAPRSVFAKHSIRTTNANYPILYFEVKVERMKQYVTIGLATKAMPLDGEVGRFEDSYGYSNGGGFWINGSKEGGKPPFYVGDVVGCGVHSNNHRLFFTKNGQPLDTVELSIASPLDSFIPCITLWDSGDQIDANFGPNFD